MKVILVQMNSRDDKAANLADAEGLMEQAVASCAADMILLPELFTYLGGTIEGAKESAEAIPDGPACQFLRQFAIKHNIIVYGGSINEKDGSDYFNSTVVFDKTGNVISQYRKIHLFDIETSDGVEYKESATYSGGTDIVTFSVGDITVGCSICYDIRFPELYVELVKADAKIIVIPAAFTLLTGKDHWETLCRARAIETQCYVLAPNQIGPYIEDGIERASFGSSMVIDPWGTVIGRARDSECFFSVDLDFEYLDRVRENVPSLQNRRL